MVIFFFFFKEQPFAEFPRKCQPPGNHCGSVTLPSPSTGEETAPANAQCAGKKIAPALAPSRHALPPSHALWLLREATEIQGYFNFFEQQSNESGLLC